VRLIAPARLIMPNLHPRVRRGSLTGWVSIGSLAIAETADSIGDVLSVEQRVVDVPGRSTGGRPSAGCSPRRATSRRSRSASARPATWPSSTRSPTPAKRVVPGSRDWASSPAWRRSCGCPVAA
jgi:hypothetical protein